MIFLIVAILFGTSAFLTFYYIGYSYTENRMLSHRIKMLQEGAAPSVMARNEVKTDFSKANQRKARKSMEYTPAFVIPWLVWSLISLVVLINMKQGIIAYIVVLVIVPFGILDVIKIVIKRQREERIRAELPGALDLMVVCLEAGLAVNSTLLRIANELDGSPLGKELRRTADEAAAGIPLADALKNFAKRTQNPDVQTIVSAIVQAEKMGTAVALTFRVQAESLREKYKMNIREKINRIPVKILFPLVVFLFPTLFVAILGPSIFSLMETFKGL